MAGTAAELFRYHAWANQRLIEFCRQLTDEQLAAASPSAYGSVAATLAHVVQAEGSFVLALTGVRPDPPAPAGEQTSLAELARQAGRSGEALAAAASSTRPRRVLRLRRPGGERDIPAVAVLA